MALALLVITAPIAAASDLSNVSPDDQVNASIELPAEQVASEDGAVEGVLPEIPGRLPVLLRMPTIGVAMEVEAVGATSDGSMGTPVDPNRAGWYQYGPWPGDPGNAAIGGHVDWAGRVRPFWYLRRLQEGDPIEIVSADGESFEFQVQWLRWYDAYNAPVEEIFGSTDVPEITLITCGGAFDHYSREYLSRLVVRAAMLTP